MGKWLFAFLLSLCRYNRVSSDMVMNGLARGKEICIPGREVAPVEIVVGELVEVEVIGRAVVVISRCFTSKKNLQMKTDMKTKTKQN